jgi:hypothetical protein
MALPAARAGADADGAAVADPACAVELAAAAELVARVVAEVVAGLLELVEQPATMNPAAVRVSAVAVTG